MSNLLNRIKNLEKKKGTFNPITIFLNRVSRDKPDHITKALLVRPGKPGSTLAREENETESDFRERARNE